MIRALKVVLIVFGVIGILQGLWLVILPGQAASMSGVSEVSGYLKYIMVCLGICLIAPSVFLIVAARDPLRHINWVKFAIVWCILDAVAESCSIVRGDVEFSNAGMRIIMDAVFAVAFLALYPYRRAKGS
jgi:hypothetical protein